MYGLIIEEKNMNLTQYLRKTYGIHNSNVEFIKRVQPLYSKLNYKPDKKILIQGLIGMALGSYFKYDKKLMDMANETLDKFLPLI
ncbi:hypothetical protein FACS1894206_09330 [Deltaproteobacteria bacterium]|nr:hypothetical protein FACS1894206_09330 [Deltaproteobacteria bacterium]